MGNGPSVLHFKFQDIRKQYKHELKLNIKWIKTEPSSKTLLQQTIFLHKFSKTVGTTQSAYFIGSLNGSIYHVLHL